MAHSYTEKLDRGTRIKYETGPDREKNIPGYNAEEGIRGRTLKGDARDLSHSITAGGKVAKT